MTNTPNPGSKEALAIGCMCPALDNSHGKGAFGGMARDGNNEVLFWISQICPIHGSKEKDGAEDDE